MLQLKSLIQKGINIMQLKFSTDNNKKNVNINTKELKISIKNKLKI